MNFHEKSDIFWNADKGIKESAEMNKLFFNHHFN